MEPIRLHGKERHEWERSVIAKHTRSRQLVLRVILDYCAGKSDCWPTNATMSRITGLKERALQYILRDLEASGTIRCIKDGSLATRRRIVLLGHPGTKEALKPREGANPFGKAVQEQIGTGVQTGSADISQTLHPKLNGHQEQENVRRPAGIPSDEPSQEQTDANHRRIMERFFGALSENTDDS